MTPAYSGAMVGTVTGLPAGIDGTAATVGSGERSRALWRGTAPGDFDSPPVGMLAQLVTLDVIGQLVTLSEREAEELRHAAAADAGRSTARRDLSLLLDRQSLQPI